MDSSHSFWADTIHRKLIWDFVLVLVTSYNLNLIFVKFCFESYIESLCLSIIAGGSPLEFNDMKVVFNLKTPEIDIFLLIEA